MSNTDGQTIGSLSAELEKAAALLRSKGMDHAAATLLAPEAEAQVVAKVAATEAKAEARAEAKAEAAAEKDDAPKRQKRKYTKRAKLKLVASEEAAPKKQKRKYTKRVKSAKTARTGAKTAATAKHKHKPVSGQSGPAIKELTFEDLNKKEKLLLGCFAAKGDREVRTIESLAAEAFKTVSAKKANSHARNSLRRPVRARLVEKPEPGSYRLTALGRKTVNK